MIRAGPEHYETVKRICNHPRIVAQFDVGTEIDPANWLADPRNIILVEGENVALFLWRWIGIYEGHCLFTARGREALDLGAAMLGLMFSHGAAMVLAVASNPRRHVHWFLRQLGFDPKGEIETIEGLSQMFQLESSQWAS